MSDPVTNVEIEDVLSSIRRLVSDGDKPRARDSAPEVEAEGSAHDAPDAVVAASDRLVLTPAFRVADEAEATPPEAEQPEDVVAEVEAEAEAETEIEAVQDEAAADDTPEEAQPAELLWTVPQSGDAADEQQDDGPAEVGETPDRSALEATIAELEASVGADEEFEPDNGSEEIDAVVWPGAATRLRAETPDAEEVSDDNADAEDAPEVAFQHHTDDADDTIEESSFADDDPVGPGEDSSFADDETDETLNAYLDDDGMMDEDMLRDLVTDIVRQELQGTMGERITRNVRKLVRREIHRILSSQDFD